ncbi:ABC transporter ATP-binding protein [Desulfopila aestuarii]|uniref:Dipeptide transport system ATP-binding protein n=1 Tax=Desulfopila aestuarii DSM 18488 TaxID=1121416 RepID=A0A1M7Y9S7_9BACT|nr:dipeptide ABC transporter ATP-binding protein [Desulfopila aestuarii]SHO49349.1 dipeptide transport system ATP-binding protein [Desulfopila aestuarii DSM 18488]
MKNEIVLQAQNLARHYDVSRGAFKSPAVVKALDGATFNLQRGKTLAVVGESGCGKSTLARLVTLIERPTSGSLNIGGVDMAKLSDNERRKYHKRVQIVFQDPYGSLNPRQKIGHALEEPLLVNTTQSKAEREKAARDMLALVGLRPEHYDRYPHMFSGGQRQRIAVARALMLDPEILVLDEPVSALDVSIQAQILNLLVELQERLELAYLFISHDLSVVHHIADEVMVMYLGVPVESGSRDTVFEDPKHPYTQALLSATPVADPFKEKRRIVLKGELPSPMNPPSGCTFHPRCSYKIDVCPKVKPEIRTVGQSLVACHVAKE